MKPTLIAAQLQEIHKEIDALHAKRTQIIQEAVSECSHPVEDIRELPHVVHSQDWIERPWLICTKCGLTEEGWGSGYDKLRHAEYAGVPKITKDDWWSLRTKTVHQGSRKNDASE